ncbi:MAG TPA: hypothetical protein VF017_07570 [Thermoanaerobaculia bacterium]|nr:hypothetical protein [Thermoanaerobaculia bacterium]
MSYEFSFPDLAESPSRACPHCGGPARVHARLQRAIYDWEITFVDCLRLSCCGRTFTSAPLGLTPRARYSDRVVALARALVASGVSLRSTARLLTTARVPVAFESLRAWCRDVAPAKLARRAEVDGVGDVLIRLREDCAVAVQSREPERIVAMLAAESRRLEGGQAAAN